MLLIIDRMSENNINPISINALLYYLTTIHKIYCDYDNPIIKI